MSGAWPTVEADLRKAMLARGIGEDAIARTLRALRPGAIAVEKAGAEVDVACAWALLGLEAKRQLDRIEAERSRAR